MEISGKKIVLEVEYDYEEFKRIYIDAPLRTPIFAGLASNPSNILIVVSISLVILYLYGQFSIFSFIATFLLVMFSIAVLMRLAALVFFKTFEFLAANHFESKGEPMPLHKKFVFDEQGIKIRSGKNKKEFKWSEILIAAEKEIKWAEILKATENEKGLFIFYDKYSLYFIPKRVFDVYEELSRLKSFIRDRISSRAEF